MEENQGVIEQAADAQAAGGTAAVEPVVEERSVPVSVIQAMRDEIKKAKEAADMYRQKAEQAQPAEQKQADAEKGPLDGMSDDDLITVSDVKRILSANSGRSAHLTTKLQHIEFAVEHPDYKEAIGNLGTALKDDPTFAAQIQEEIKHSSNPLATAYRFAKLIDRTPKKQKSKEIDIMADLDRILANQNKPASPAQVQGNGGGGVSKAERIKQMTPEEFDRHIANIKNG